MLWWRHEHGAVKFPKTWRGTLGYRPKIHHFSFSHKWDTRFKYLSKLCPYILMYSALHIMQWFSHSLDVFTPKIKRKFFDFYILWIKTNVAYTRHEMIARTKYCTTTTASNWFVTLYYKLLPAVRSPSKHGRWWSSLLLYSISMYCTCTKNSRIKGYTFFSSNFWSKFSQCYYIVTRECPISSESLCRELSKFTHYFDLVAMATLLALWLAKHGNGRNSKTKHRFDIDFWYRC